MEGIGRNIALLLSGGTGMRLGADIPKQYIKVCGRPVISYCIEKLLIHEKIHELWIVADTAWQPFILECIEKIHDCNTKKFKGFSIPGENRQLSVFHGLCDIKNHADDKDYVFIHDAARPLLSQKQISECLNMVRGYDGLVPVLPMKDTVYASDDGKKITSLLKRNEIFAGQAPEVFRLGKYLEANRRLLPDKILKINGSTEPAILAGMNIAMISGDEANFKITTKGDLERFERIVVERMQCCDRQREERGQYE